MASRDPRGLWGLAAPPPPLASHLCQDELLPSGVTQTLTSRRRFPPTRMRFLRLRQLRKAAPHPKVTPTQADLGKCVPCPRQRGHCLLAGASSGAPEGTGGPGTWWTEVSLPQPSC